MPDRSELQASGYDQVYRSDKFEIWVNPGKERLYVLVLTPPSSEDVDLALKQAASLSLPQMDIITDHSLMPPTNQVQDRDVFVCMDPFFDRFRVRNIVRVCDPKGGSCNICTPLDTRLSEEEKGRIQGRVYTFRDANDLLDHQHGAPGV